MRISSSFVPATVGATAVATATSTASLLYYGKHHARTPWAPIDAVSHIAWGDRAFARDELDLRHTFVGFLLNLGAMASWSALHAFVVGRQMRTRVAVPLAFASGAAVAAVAYIVDFKVMPKRFTPGFEWKLPRQPLRRLYGLLAASFAAGSLLARAVR